MRTIVLPKTDMPAADILRSVLSAASAKGLSLNEVRARLKVASKLSAGLNSVTLDDGEFFTLKSVFEAHVFGAAHADIGMIADAIDDVSQKAK